MCIVHSRHISFLENLAFPLWDFFHLDHDFGRIETADMSSSSIFPVTRIHVDYFSQLPGCLSQEGRFTAESSILFWCSHWSERLNTRQIVLNSSNVWKNLKQLIDGFEGREKLASNVQYFCISVSKARLFYISGLQVQFDDFKCNWNILSLAGIGLLSVEISWT